MSKSKRLVQNIFDSQPLAQKDYKRRLFNAISPSSVVRQTVNMDRVLADSYTHLQRGYAHQMDYSRPALNSNEMYTARQEIPNELNNLPSCSECGVLFSTLYDLQKHVKRGCPMDEDNNSITESHAEEKYDSDTDFHDSGFDRLIEKVYAETDKQFVNKV